MKNLAKTVSLLLLSLMTSGCSRELVERMYHVDYTPTNRFAKNLAPLPSQFIKDTAALDALSEISPETFKTAGGKKKLKLPGKKTTSNISTITEVEPMSILVKAELP
jgi:membrane-bound lytic murein transglycosylase C